ncbi:MAG: ankyrin repeat domain-containing protein [Proteobacteria bacterium]|nr:ankyrin repeat domain-containing protein [Pseudomonadota bacterium]
MTAYDQKDFFEVERLHRAAAEGDIQEMQRLVECGYSLEFFDDLGRAPLHYAVEGQHYKAVEWLITAGANVNSNDEEHIGETPLCYAVQSGYPDLVELLLRNGADPDITGWMANTARIRAAKRKDDEGKKISALLERYKPSTPDTEDR